MKKKRQKTKDKEVEDLGGYLKGKISKEMASEDVPELTDEKEYDNSDVEEDEKDKDFDLDLLDSDKKSANKMKKLQLKAIFMKAKLIK